MIPEIDTQLAAVIKSLSDNVLPAVDSSNPLAGEQIRLCLATLGMIKKRLPDLHRYQRHELELNLDLLTSLAEVATNAGLAIPDLTTALNSSRETLNDATMGATEIEQQVRAVKDKAVSVVNAARGTAAETEVMASVLNTQEAMDLCRRAWTLEMGFEPDPSQIPALNQLLCRQD
ncbi:MAG: hypothetical protein H7A02_13830 [Pseudomonadales bacterium]|nr:hypothetical protein [Pseudomonadales bacterium]